VKVAVIGAGIAGITAAYYLSSKAKADVTVYEREPYSAMRASYANGGQLSASNCEVWTTWANVLKGFKWMFKEEAPLLIRPSIEIDKIAWILKFLLATSRNDADVRTVNTIKYAIRARRLYNTIARTENIKFDYRKSGILHIYKNNKYFEHAISMKDMYESNGVEWTQVTPDKCLQIEPRLYHMKDDLVGGIWTESDGVGDAHKFCNELQRVMEKKYNVKFVFNHVVNNVNELDEYDRIVIANGSDACALKIDNIQVYPIKGYSITIDHAHGAPAVSLLDDETKIVCSRLGDRLRVAGTAEIAGHNRDITRRRIIPLLKWVKKNFPNVETKNYSSWACLRPMTPDMMPIINKSQINNKVYYHCGHGHLGWTIAPATALHLVNSFFLE
jgi:D-amino-acid dehydrogenase